MIWNYCIDEASLGFKYKILIFLLQKIMLSFHAEQEVLPETFLANFPSLIKMDIHKKVTDPSVAKSMMACLLSSLKANGTHKLWARLRYRVLYLPCGHVCVWVRIHGGREGLDSFSVWVLGIRLRQAGLVACFLTDPAQQPHPYL